jgi:tripeptidyl-peptidase-1
MVRTRFSLSLSINCVPKLTYILVTAVGATQIKNGSTVTDPEEAVYPFNEYDFSSGGGFSNVFARPSYQETAVASFLTNNKQLPPSSTYNQTGRAFPDVSANGWNIINIVQGQYVLESGTSSSAPIFGSIITRLNEERITAGKGPIGFLNPTLYAHPEMFNDITEGFNLGCNLTTAFVATKGWDPVTGLGTPNYPKMQQVFLSLP